MALTLLERLREQSEAARAADVAARRPLESARREISSRLWQTFQWLDEAVGYLGVIRPVVKRRFRLTDTVIFDRPHFDHGYVAFRRKGLHDSEIIDHVEWQYRLVAAEPVTARVGIAAVQHLDERLRTALLRYDYESEQDHNEVVRYGVFRIEPAISASVRFRPDYVRELVEVTLHNVDRFESLRLEFAPDTIGEPALEELVRCVLGESDRFLHLAPVALKLSHDENADSARRGPAGKSHASRAVPDRRETRVASRKDVSTGGPSTTGEPPAPGSRPPSMRR